MLGIAKPIPSLPPDCDKINVFIPTRRPAASTSGPPLFPGLMGASVWMKILGSSSLNWRAAALTIPMLTELSMPSGLPKASTSSPCLRSVELPKTRAWRPVASIFKSARSSRRSFPMSFPSNIELCLGTPFALTRMVRAPSTTCALVMMYPSSDMITPEPVLRSLERTLAPVCCASDSKPYPVAVICTTDGEIRPERSCNERLNSPSEAALPLRL